MNNTKVIAEIGVNHNGSILLAKKLIDKAAESGADFAKFQIFKADNLAIKNSKKANYQNKNLNNKITQHQMLKNYEIDLKKIKIINDYCIKKKIKFLASCFDIESTNLYLKFKPKYIKIPSGEITNHQLLEYVGKKKIEVIISTGMSRMKEVEKAVDILIKAGTSKKKITVLQCTTDYPAELKDSNLNCIQSLKKKLKTKVGFSDHTRGDIASIIATSLGSTIIEKHLTLDKKMKGPDHLASMNFNEFKDFVKKIKSVNSILGINIKKPSLKELKNLKYVRKSIYAKKAIKKGQSFSYKNIIPKRPMNGMSANKIKQIIGRKAKKNFKIDEKITL